jgi:hypothetical protein
LAEEKLAMTVSGMVVTEMATKGFRASKKFAGMFRCGPSFPVLKMGVNQTFERRIRDIDHSNVKYASRIFQRLPHYSSI